MSPLLGWLNRGRPTLYKGIRMRSRLEAWHAAWFDAHGLAWEYEPICFADETGQYLPDFRVAVPDRFVYVEIKGLVEDPEPFMERAEIVWNSDPQARLTLIEGHYEHYWYTRWGPADGVMEWVEYSEPHTVVRTFEDAA